ncbi:hypothetical protein EJB05_49158 [Eragrostis curvula]|uniref:Uncharacterized protein n=1 Tax=Eragrostis curvula TaxID=38414 RepID=A0A5J9T3T4_9POAL|nr:hypothetical protein EJB05_49158 [Eragrostis curvula]
MWRRSSATPKTSYLCNIAYIMDDTYACLVVRHSMIIRIEISSTIRGQADPICLEVNEIQRTTSMVEYVPIDYYVKNETLQNLAPTASMINSEKLVFFLWMFDPAIHTTIAQMGLK